MAFSSAEYGQNVGQLNVVRQRPGVAGLNHRSVGDGVAKRDAQFEDVGAGVDGGFDQLE